VVIVPSIDVRHARVVARGAIIDMTPTQLASRFVTDGAEELHLVDLDGAERGDHANLGLLAQIARTCGVPARLAGGISSVALAREALDAGFAGVLFSSSVFGDDDLLREVADLGDSAIVEIEARVPPGGSDAGWLAPRGGAPELVEAATGRGVLAAARAAVDRGIGALYVIDLGSEGRIGGPPHQLLDRLRESLGAHAHHVQFHTGGGIGTLEDVRALARWGAASAVIGRALVEGRFTIEEAKAAAGADGRKGTERPLTGP
jgi:phosphoribosylformimino-5-aminoimidazole carboxamide ribotide isomerase